MNTHFTDAIAILAALNVRYLAAIGNPQAQENIEAEFRSVLKALDREAQQRQEQRAEDFAE